MRGAGLKISDGNPSVTLPPCLGRGKIQSIHCSSLVPACWSPRPRLRAGRIRASRGVNPLSYRSATIGRQARRAHGIGGVSWVANSAWLRRCAGRTTTGPHSQRSTVRHTTVPSLSPVLTSLHSATEETGRAGCCAGAPQPYRSRARREHVFRSTIP